MPSIITVGGSSSTSTGGSTFGDVIEKVYRRVMGGIRERTVNINQTNGLNPATIGTVYSLSNSAQNIYYALT
jgi:hypothetical protein